MFRDNACPLMADIFLFLPHMRYALFSKKGVRRTGLSFFLSDDQLRGTVDSSIVSKFRKDDVRLLRCHRR